VIPARDPPAAPTGPIAVPTGLTLDAIAGVDRLSGDVEAVGRDEIEPLTAILSSRLEGPLTTTLIFDVDAAVAVVGDRRYANPPRFRWRSSSGFEPGVLISAKIENAKAGVTGQ
jgi:hypothetical protein